MTAKSDIRDRIKLRLSNIPAALTDDTIDQMVEKAHIQIENFTGDSFSTSSIDEKYESVIEDIAFLEVIDYTISDVIDKNVSIGGDLNINFGDLRTSLEKIRSNVEGAVKKQLNMLGVHRDFVYTEP